MLQLNAVVIQRGGQSFGPFSFRVAAGERVAILGPSGAGKSTLLKLISREWTADSGWVLFRQRQLEDWTWPALSHCRAVLPQAGEVAFGLPVELVIGLGRIARGDDPALADIVLQAARIAHASHLLGRGFDTLSGGEQARVQLARLFAQMWDVQGGLILVDEPMAALDPGLQFDLLDSLERFAAQRYHAVIAVMHDINHALQSANRLLLIKQGQLLQDLPSSAAALPALESLYGIGLSGLADAQGQLVVAPRRRVSGGG